MHPSSTPLGSSAVERNTCSVVESENRRPPALTIVVPCYNEEAVLPETASRLLAALEELIRSGEVNESSHLYFVDDGSTDKTWYVIENLSGLNSHCHAVRLSRNYGHQNALLAGLLGASGECVISIDADLQDDLEAIPNMVKAYLAGADIVYGVRRSRRADTFFKRATAEIYYRLLGLLGVRVVFNHADYRLLSRRALEALAQYREANLFLRGLIPQLGFNSATVYYDRHERLAGKSKYPVVKMFALAVNGITSFSAVPLRLITVLGILISFASFGAGLWALWARVAGLGVVPGWASTVIPLYMLGGIQLLSTGVIGQYLAKVYLETKARPRFLIEKTL